MSRVYDKPVMIQRQDEQTEVWEDYLEKPLHARVNTATEKTVGFAADADQFHARELFEFRYMSVLEQLRYTPQLFRLCYRGHTYHVVGYDDYLEQHRTVRITGALYE